MKGLNWRIFSCLIALIIASPIKSHAQKVATIEVALPRTPTYLDVPVRFALDGITFLADSSLSLIEVKGNQRINVPFQISQGDQRTMEWIIKPDGKSNKSVYELMNRPAPQENAVRADIDTQSITVVANSKNLLRYYFGTLYPPANVDTAFKRSGFIHPLWAPRGQELTRIQPPDHYHHYGIWNPWTHVLYKGDTVDFWNLADRKGTVRFAKLISAVDGPVFSEFQVLHEHVATKKNAPEEIALNELQTIRVYRPGKSQDYYFVDFVFQLSCATQNPITLLKYRYGGLGWRATEKWNKDNSEVVTSDGKGRKEADGSTARWVIVQGTLDQDYGGAAILSHPNNYNHPEPLRVWPEDQYNRGDVFVNYSPTKDRDWNLVPGKIYTLKYRMVVFNGHFTKEKAESAWNGFAAGPKTTVK